MFQSNCQFQTKNSGTFSTTAKSCKKWQSPIIPALSTTSLQGTKVQLLPAAKNNRNVLQTRQLANCLAERLNQNGVNAFVSNNTNIRDVNLTITVGIGSSRYSFFRLRYFGNPAYTLAATIQERLWFYHLTQAFATSATAQRNYELARQGIVPLHIIFPGSPAELIRHAAPYCVTLAGAITYFISETVRNARGEGGFAANTTFNLNPKVSAKTKLHCRSCLLFNVKRTNNDIDRMYRQAG